MSARRFFSSGSFDTSRPSAGPDTANAAPASGPFQFNFPIDSIQSLTQNIINSVNNSPTIANLMSGSRTSTFPSENFASSGRESPGCDSCQNKFTVFRRRKTCMECDCDYCSTCFSSSDLLSDTRPNRRVCRRCRIFSARPLDRLLLMTLRVRDLRWYLERQNISVSHCKEKTELVDLVLRQNGYRVPSFGSGAAAAAASSYRSRRQDDAQPGNTSNDEADEWIFVDNNEEETPAAQASGPAASTSPKVVPETCDSDFRCLSVDDLQSEDHIRQLSARQLKLILARNFVDFKGCCERDELMEKVLRLWRERREAKKLSLEDISDENLCKICMEQAIDCVLLECGHMISCVSCGKRLAECPICRQYVVRAVRIFKS